MRTIASKFMLAATASWLAGCATVPAAPPPATAVPAEVIAMPTDAQVNEAFEKVGRSYVDILTALDPVAATGLGDHEHDADLPALGPEARATEAAMYRNLQQALGQIDPARLTRENQVDYALLKNRLAYDLWDLEVLQTWAWNPQVYNNTAANALYSLVARDFAPWPQRFENIVARMEKIPAYLEASRQQLDPARVPKIQAETVSRQNAGLMEIVDAALMPEVARSGVERTRFDAALAGLKTAVTVQQTWLDTVLVPNARGDFRLAPELYDQKMRFALQRDIPRTELKAKAQAAYDEARAQMETVARTFPECDKGNQQQAIECALAKSYARRATRTTLEDEARATLATATAFTAERGFVAMPSGPVQIITMPKFQQGNAVAYDDAPGPLERDQPNFYAISPIPAEWSDAQATSFLTEYNWYMLHELSIHEGVPGHYLQLDHASRFPGMLRAVLQSGPFVEGWAVYSERVMAEEGYLGGRETVDGRLFELTMLKMRLRSIVNTLLDIGIHTEGMTREQAMELMTVGAFQQEREAAGKWVRGQLSSVQLLSYFSGYEEHLEMRREAERRWGKDFDLRKYHDAALAHGSPPAKYVRALLFDLPIE
ncbi:DUF885 domain-containing protein [Tsuneonella sp. HG222]